MSRPEGFSENGIASDTRNPQSLGRGVAAGSAAAMVGAVLWAGITVVTEFQVGWMAVGVGLLVAVAVRFAGKGVDRSFGVAGAFLALLGCMAGNLLATYMFHAGAWKLSLFQVFSELSFAEAVDGLLGDVGLADLLFYGIALYAGYLFSFRRGVDR